MILSIDPGWILGWAVFREKELLENGVMDLERNLSECGRYRNLWSFLLGLVARHKFINTLLVEPAFGRWRSTRNGEICGIIKLFGYQMGMDVVERNVQSTRSKLGLKGKKEVLAYACEWLQNESLSQHEADAICQGLAYLKEKK